MFVIMLNALFYKCFCFVLFCFTKAFLYTISCFVHYPNLPASTCLFNAHRDGHHSAADYPLTGTTANGNAKQTFLDDGTLSQIICGYGANFVIIGSKKACCAELKNISKTSNHFVKKNVSSCFSFCICAWCVQSIYILTISVPASHNK